MATIASDETGQVQGETDNELERRFRELGARALIEEVERLSGTVAELSGKLADIERANKLVLSLLDFPLPALNPLQRPLPKRLIVTAKMYRNPEDGFYGVERSADGTEFRWTGPQSEFRFIVSINRKQKCVAELTLVNNDFVNGALACYVDRSQVPSEAFATADRKLTRITFTLPELETNRGTELLFVTPAVRVPSAVIAGSTDSRSLGVQFVELRVGPSGDGGGGENSAADVEQSAN